MKKLVALLLVSMIATVAFAGIDPDTDSFGVYFDTANNINCTNSPAFVPFNAYVVLMNPAGPVNGWEATVTPSGAPYFVLGTTLGGSGALDVDSSANGFAVGAASNLPVVNGGVTLVTLNIMLQAAAPLEFRIGQASIPSMTGGLPVAVGDNLLRRGGVASGNVTLPCATVNGGCPVPAETSTFGAVKSLFR